MKFMVETRFGYGWQNCWSEDDKPVYFNSIAEAEQEIESFLEDEQNGHIEQPLTREDLRVMPISEEEIRERWEESIVEIMQDTLEAESQNNYYELWDLIQDNPDLDEEEKEWAHMNLSVALAITRLSK